MVVPRSQRAAAAVKIIHYRFVHAEWEIHFRADHCRRAGKSLRRHTNNRVDFPVDLNARAQHVRIGAGFFPIRVADNRHRQRGAGPLFFRGERPALRERHPERREIIGRHHVRKHAPGAVAISFRNADHGHVVRHQAAERTAIALITKRRVVSVRKRAVAALVRVAAVYAHQRRRRLNHQRLEKKRVHQAEDRGVRADPQPQHQHGRTRKSNILAKHSRAHARIAQQIPHRVLLRKLPQSVSNTFEARQRFRPQPVYRRHVT